MSYEIRLSAKFEKEAKRLLKKYPSLKSDIIQFRDELKLNPQQGSPIGKGCYKIRMTIASKGKGKSGGARIITYVQIVETTVYLLTIYDKSEKENISDSELSNILNSLE